jgi:hypothetical protein
MRIGIDLDGTAWEHRELFSELTKYFLQKGDEVYILTSHTNLKDHDLVLWKSRGFPANVKYCSKLSGEEGIPSREWKLSKAKELGLDYIFDDFDTGEVRLIRI